MPSVPIFASSQFGEDKNVPKNSAFNQTLRPAIRVPLGAKNCRMSLQQASMVYSMSNVATGAANTLTMSANSQQIMYSPRYLESFYEQANLPSELHVERHLEPARFRRGCAMQVAAPRPRELGLHPNLCMRA